MKIYLAQPRHKIMDPYRITYLLYDNDKYNVLKYTLYTTPTLNVEVFVKL